MKQDYTVMTEAWIDGALRQMGDVITLNPAEAATLLVLGTVTEGEPEQAAQPEAQSEPARGRRGRDAAEGEAV